MALDAIEETTIPSIHSLDVRPAFQPIVDRYSNAWAMEVLFRLRDGGPFDRERLITQMEKSGIVTDLDLQMLSLAIRHVCLLANGSRFSVNISARTVEHFPGQILEIIEHSPATARSRLILEITETWNSTDVQSLIDFSRRCQMGGVMIALDDCMRKGGANTEEMISAIRPNVIKIASEVIDNASAKHASQTSQHDGLRRFIEWTQRRCGALVIAEGIENQTLYDLAFDLGANFVQGYFIGMPRQMRPANGSNCPIGFSESECLAMRMPKSQALYWKHQVEL